MFPFHALLRYMGSYDCKISTVRPSLPSSLEGRTELICISRYFDFHNIKAANKASRSLGLEEARVFHTFWIFLFVRERRPRAIRLELASDSDAQRG